jgi:hypothetical protein
MKSVPTLCALASVMLAAAPSVPSAAARDDSTVVLKINGHVSAVGAYIDQSQMGELDRAALAIDSGLFVSLSSRLDGGGEVGARVAFDLDYATNFDAVLNDAGATDVLEEAWIFWDSRLGRLQLGLQDGAADILSLGVPSVSSSIRVDGPEVFLMAYPCSTLCSSEPFQPGSLYSPNSMQLRSDIHGSDNFLKVMYVTPDIHGLRLAVSYAPDGSRDLGDLLGNDEPNEQGRIWDFAANYLQAVGDIDVGLSVGHVTGKNVRNSSPGFFGDLDEWGASARLGYREWTVGAAWRKTNVFGGGPVNQSLFSSNVFDDLYTEVWSYGVTYETGPWMLGANYITSTQELGGTSEQDGLGYQLSGAYTVNEYLRLSAGYQRYEFEGPFDTCVVGLTFLCDTLDADIGYVETTFRF